MAVLSLRLLTVLDFKPHVKILRDFRDKYLFSSCVGRMLVKCYYKYSPPIAEFIIEHETLKTVVRVSLIPLVAFSYAALHLTITVIILFIFFIEISILILHYRKLPR